MARMFSSTTFFGETENSSFAHCGDNGRLLFPAIGGTGEPSARALDFATNRGDEHPAWRTREQRRAPRYSIASALFDRECRGRRMALPRTMLPDFVSSESSTYNFDNEVVGGGMHQAKGAPPFCVEFGRSKLAGKLAAADEEGFVSLIDTTKPKDERESNVHKWMCHRNAIFDQAFSDGDSLLATASGDQTIRVWNMDDREPELTATLRGHKGSVKSVRFRPESQHEIVSGAREGSIVLWDTRIATASPVGSMEVKPLQRRTSAHVRSTKKRGAQGGAQGTQGAGRGRGADSQQSVTSVLFVDTHVLASAGANDGTVKLWDLRKAWGTGSQPFKSFLSREARATGRPRGISSLSVNATRSKLLASSTDHRIYMFDCTAPERDPVTFSGHSNSSFYVKSTFSPDGRFIVSGSSDYDVFVWDAEHPLLPPLKLHGHHGEVSDVAWCPTDMSKLASCSDDTTVRLWTLERELAAGRRLALNKEPTGQAVAEAAWLDPQSQSVNDLLICQETMLQSSTGSPAMSVSWGGSSDCERAPVFGGGAGALQWTPSQGRVPLDSEDEEGGEEAETSAQQRGAARNIFGRASNESENQGGVSRGMGGAGAGPALKQAKLSDYYFTPLRRRAGEEAAAAAPPAEEEERAAGGPVEGREEAGGAASGASEKREGKGKERKAVRGQCGGMLAPEFEGAGREPRREEEGVGGAKKRKPDSEEGGSAGVGKRLRERLREKAGAGLIADTAA